MPISEAREAEIRQLSNDEWVERVDDTGFTDADWERLEAEFEARTEAFCRDNRDPEELHAFVDSWNWDKGTWAIQEILDNPACEAATALLVYWLAGPEFYLPYADRAALAAADSGDWQLEAFDFITALEARYVDGCFPVGVVAFDPAAPDLYLVGSYDDMKPSFVRSLPAVMYQAVKPA